MCLRKEKVQQNVKINMKKLVIYKKHSIYGAMIIAVIIFFSLGVFIGEDREQNNLKKFIATFKNIREKNRGFSFISPLLGSVSAPATDVGIYRDIRSDVKDYLEGEKSKGNLYDFSFYFKDLNSPLWFGINEDVSFSPASLFKLPIAIAVYREGENEPSFLNKTIVYTQEMATINKNTPSNEDSTLVVGNSYSVEELIQIMLEKSDNGAKDLLASVVDKKYISELFTVVSLVDPVSVQSYEVSSRKYALFLRLLYNSSFLNEQHSEYVLSLLAKSTFKDGIVAGLPKNVVVAHKFGTYETRSVVKGVTIKSSILSDCGIVYYEEAPYALCFMTKGKDIPNLFKIISHVSQLVYQDAEKDR